MSTVASPDISVIVVSWNGRRYLDECLAAVAAQQGAAFETILVDNGSTDGSAEYVRERYPWVRVVVLAENRGFAGGNNTGAREAARTLPRVSQQRHRR
jgi:GT2 family glycosyltransferase